MSTDSKSVPAVDAHTGTATTGHDWDGIHELNTPLPRWWLVILYATIVWSFGYFIVYPAVPLVSSYTKGLWGWSSRGAVDEEVAQMRALRAPNNDKIAKASLADIEKDPQLLAFARASGKAAFGDIGLVFPLVVPAIGVLTAVIGIFAVTPRATDRSGMSAINRGFFISAIVSAVLVIAAVFWLLPAKIVDLKGVVVDGLGIVTVDTFNVRFFAIGAVLIGIVLAAAIQLLHRDQSQACR